jgi:adenylate kinase
MRPAVVAAGTRLGRSDDNEAVIRNRLKEYNQKTLPVLQFYRDKGIYVEVDGTAGIEAVHQRISEIVRNELSKRLFNVVVFGYPGSGRGSQGKAVAQKFGLEYVATGPMLDQEIKAGSDIGKKITAMYENGQLVPDEIVVQLIEKKLANSKDVKGFIFKGFPRTLVQSYILDGLLKSTVRPSRRSSKSKSRPWNSSGGWTNGARRPTACRMTAARRRS